MLWVRRVSLAGGVVALAAVASMMGATAAVSAPAGPALPATPTTSAPVDAACYTSAPAPVGMPTVKAGGAAGFYLWRDAASWHLRVTQPGHNGITYTGVLVACEQAHYANYLLEAPDKLLGTASNPDALGFQLSDFGQVDGFEFAAACPTTWTFSLLADGRPVPTQSIFVGGSDLHPATNPFALSQGCPNEPVGTVTYGSSTSLPPASEATLKKLDEIALLSLTNLGTFHSLNVTVAPRPVLFGDPGIKVVSASSTQNTHHWYTGMGATVALIVEIALAVGIVVLFFLSRRRRTT